MKNNIFALILVCLSSAALWGCGTENLWQEGQTDLSDPAARAARLLEEGRDAEALALIKQQLPVETLEILGEERPDYGNFSYAKRLGESLKPVPDGEHLISLLATAFAAVRGVRVTDLVINLAELDPEAGDPFVALGKVITGMPWEAWFKLLPAQCEGPRAAENPAADLKHAIGINDSTLAVRPLTGVYAAYEEAYRQFDGYEDMDKSIFYFIRERAMPGVVFHNAVFAHVALMCSMTAYDKDGDHNVSTAEAIQLQNPESEEMYLLMDLAVETLGALSRQNPDHRGLSRTYTNLRRYLAQANAYEGMSRLDKMRFIMANRGKYLDQVGL